MRTNSKHVHQGKPPLSQRVILMAASNPAREVERKCPLGEAVRMPNAMLRKSGSAGKGKRHGPSPAHSLIIDLIG